MLRKQLPIARRGDRTQRSVAASGTTFDEISGSVIKNLKCKIPPANIALDFNEKCKPIFNYQRTIENEIKELVELRQLVVSQISKR